MSTTLARPITFQVSKGAVNRKMQSVRRTPAVACALMPNHPEPSSEELGGLPAPDGVLLSRRDFGRASLGACAAAIASGAVMTSPALAALSAYDVSGKGILEATMELGTPDNQNVFVPNELSFEQGRVYKLHLKNVSQVEHYFTALGFASKVFTIIVEVDGTEVKGAVTEVALEGGKELTWIFIPMKPGRYELVCPIKGHAETMRGTLVITPAGGVAGAGKKK